MRYFGKQFLTGPRGLLLVLTLLISPLQASDKSISVPGLFNGKVLMIIDGKRHLLAVGDSTPDGVRLDAIEANRVLVEINGSRRSVAIGTAATTLSVPDNAEVSISPDRSGMYYIQGRINRSSVDFLVDTGANSVAMSSRTARRIGLNYISSSRETRVSTASGVARAWSVTLDKVQVGGISLSAVEAVVIEGNHPREVLLGNTFLHRIEMVREGRVMILRQKW